MTSDESPEQSALAEKENDDQFDLTINTSDHEKFRRLDHYLKEKLPDYSRNFIQNLFKQDLITAEIEEKSISISLNKMPPLGTKLSVSIPPPIPVEAQPENIPLEILYEDEYLLFINKTAGIVVHPAPGNYTGTLVNALLHHITDLKGIGNKLRPGIVHRLDVGTSGVMVVAKEQKCHEKLVMTFAEHDLDRKYIALVMGQPKIPAGKLESYLGRHPQNRLKMAVTMGGKWAVTHYKTLEVFPKSCLMEMTLETGRTHQIRVHLSSLLKTPIFNDATYGNPKEHLQRVGLKLDQLIGQYPHPFLHAKLLSLKHPITGKLLSFETPPPPLFQQVLNTLRGEKIGT